MTYCTDLCARIFSSDIEVFLALFLVGAFCLFWAVTIVQYASYEIQIKYGPYPVTYRWYNCLPTNAYVTLVAITIAVSTALAFFSVVNAFILFIFGMASLYFYWLLTINGYRMFGYAAGPGQLAYTHLNPEVTQQEPPLTDVAKEILLRELRKKPE